MTATFVPITVSIGSGGVGHLLGRALRSDNLKSTGPTQNLGRLYGSDMEFF